MSDGADFMELRLISSRSTNIKIEDREVRNVSTRIDSEAAVRALVGGSWGFSSTDRLDSIDSCKEAATELARSINAVQPRSRLELAPYPEHRMVVHSPKEDIEDVGINEKIELLTEICSCSMLPGVVNVRVNYAESKVGVEYSNSEGVNHTYELQRSGFSVRVVARESGDIQQSSRSHFNSGGMEVLRDSRATGIARDTAKTAVELLKAKKAPAGTFPVLLDPRLAGVFIHEALGHACEADAVVEGNSVLADMLGEKIAVSEITVYDDPTKLAFGHLPVDGEGVVCAPHMVIENGVLRNFLHSRETAGIMGGEPGNARAEGTNRPIVRMTNMYIEQGDRALEELMDGWTGIYLVGTRGGSVDTAQGLFQFNAQRAYNVEKGRITTHLRDVSISGSTLDLLAGIDGVGNDLEFCSGICGKHGQGISVGDGSPHIRVKNALVGGTL